MSKGRSGNTLYLPALLTAAAAWGVLAGASIRARASDISVTPLARDGQVLVSFELSDGFTAQVCDEIQSGLPTTFACDLELRRDVPTWFDRTLAAVTISVTVRFDNLTRRYQLSRSVDGSVEDTRPTEDIDAVRRWMTRFERVPLSGTAALGHARFTNIQ